MLQAALDRRGAHVHCAALINDTVGTLLAHSYTVGDALIGAIFGTGTNGCYVERTAKITKLGVPEDKPSEKAKTMVINTECAFPRPSLASTASLTDLPTHEGGAFDNERRVLRINRYDNKLDRRSINPRKQAFEKLVSGMYLGEMYGFLMSPLTDDPLADLPLCPPPP
jgi:hexokinase